MHHSLQDFERAQYGVCCGELAELAKDMNPLEPVGHIPAPLWGIHFTFGAGNLASYSLGKILLNLILKNLKENAILETVIHEYL